MLFHWIYPLSHQLSVLNIFKYITVRSFIAFFIAIVVSIIWGKFFIKYMREKQFGQAIREDGPATHKKKAGTPTFGGVFICGSILVSVLLAGNFHSAPFIFVLLIMAAYFILGWFDDYLKVLKKNSKGVSAKAKLLWQFGTAMIATYLMIRLGVIDTNLYVPFIKGPIVNLGWFYIAFASLVIVGSSNAVNLTDGLDGLAIAPIITSAVSLSFLAYVAGHTELSTYLYIPYIERSGEIMVLTAAIIGAGLGFLWYNSYPAQIFMGDVGSLSLGGALGTAAVLTKNEFLFFIIGGLFVVEALSVILQVGSYKLRKKRIFKMAPIHHHFELLGWHESKVIVRFWIISVVFALLALATLKLR